MLIKKIVALAPFLIVLLFSTPAYCLTDILNIRNWAAPDHTRIVIDTSDDVEIRVSKSPQRISIDFRNTQYPEDLALEFALNKPGIEKIQVTPFADDAVNIVLMLAAGTEGKVFKLKEIQDKPFRVVIDLKSPDIEKKESEARRRFRTVQKDKIIVIDPGHGGEDPGAIGPRKTMEKDVVLKIAQKLEWLLNHREGYRAFLTRNGDYYPSFKQRLRIAKEYGADLFISIHADASRSRHPYGSSVYCLSTKGASSEAARLLARQENLADIVGGSESDHSAEESDPITLDMIQTETINKSKLFGTTILNHFEKISAVKFPRIQEAPFMVLKLPHIPSILVETGYISNPKEEMLLRNNRHQNRIALALCNSIQKFLHAPEKEDDIIRTVMEEKIEAEQPEKNAPPAPQKETVSRPLPRMILYKVKKGETLNSIAKKFNTSPVTLAKLNHLTGKTSLKNRLLKVYVPAEEKPPRKVSQPKPSRPAPKRVFHTVKRGESLSGIAQKYNLPVGKLAAANKIKPAAPLHVSKRLTIPPSEMQSEAKKDSEPAFVSKTKPKYHIVKRGESIEKIAKLYGVTTAALLKANNMKLKDNLWIDRKIRIP